MFDAGSGRTLDRQPLDRARAALNLYFDAIAPISRCARDIPSAIFELSTSARPEVAQYILDERMLEAMPCPSHSGVLLRLALRETVKLALFKMLAFTWRVRHGRRGAQTRRWASTLMVGFANFCGGRLRLQDYSGFVDSEVSSARRVSLALRLPQTPLRDFFRACDAETQPIHAFMAWSDLIRGWKAAWQLLHTFRYQATPLQGTRVEALALQDIANGHFMHGWLVARAIARCIRRDISPAAPVVLPMERHDWELLATYWLKAMNRKVWSVQNCTFSANDLNMHTGMRAAPAYRNVLPDRLYVVAERWFAVFEALGVDAPMRVLERHRFSGRQFVLDLRSGVQRLLYLGSINREKVNRDLAVLARLSNVKTELRLHPSMSDLPAAAAFPKATSLNGLYGAAVYADTTMVFQLDADRSRLLFLDHPSFPNQDPARFFTDWPGVTIDCADEARAAASIAAVLRQSDEAICSG